jgi:peptidoglycan hydrolase-like protein with peptidoglycan-binding domain
MPAPSSRPSRRRGEYDSGRNEFLMRLTCIPRASSADPAGQEEATTLADQPDLRKGEPLKDWVVYLEQVLEYRGYWSEGATGVFDDKLEQSVIRFQESTGLAPDGFVGAKTWDALTATTSGNADAEVSSAEVSSTVDSTVDSTGGPTVAIDWAREFPAIYAISQHPDLDDYLRNVAGVDPAILETIAREE